MDCITGAIEKKLHLCGNRMLESQTWDRFEKEAAGKPVFVFGTGNGLEYLFQYCFGRVQIAGFIDNDCHKWGHKLIWHCTEAWGTQYENYEIQGIEALEAYSGQDAAVLITSTKYYKEMIGQLKQRGIANYYVLLMLEVNERRSMAFLEKDEREEKNNFVKKCTGFNIVLNKIVMSIGEYGGHAKAITRQLLNIRKDLDIVWLVYDAEMEAPKGVRLVPEKNWKSYVYELETSKLWLFDITVEDYIVKREGQIYVQAKHWSSITLKKFYLDDKSSCTSPEIEAWIRHNGEMMDYLLSGSRFDELSCRSGFAFQGKSVRVGSPRSDILFDKTVKGKVHEYFHIPSDANILLYAPTYRKEGLKITLDIDMLINVLKLKFGGEWYVLVRLHPWIDFGKCGLNETEQIINASDYQESEELVAAADSMVTDYSSIMFEAAYIKTPVFLYAPDRRNYIDAERGLLLDYDTLPFPSAETNERLMVNIFRFNLGIYKKNVADFLAYHEVYEDGQAGKRAAAVILKILANALYEGEKNMTDKEKRQFIFENLQDDKSKFIFENRQKYAEKGERKYIENIVRTIPEYKDNIYYSGREERLYRIMESCSHKIVMWGAGFRGDRLYRDCQNRKIEIDYIIDNDKNKQGTFMENTPILSFQEVLEKEHARKYLYVVTSMYFADEIKMELIKSGCKNIAILNEHIHCVLQNQYFEEDIIAFEEGEVFIDGGCFDLETTKQFMARINEQGKHLKKVYAYEPDRQNYENCKRKLNKEKLGNVELVNAGLWSKNTYVIMDVARAGTTCARIMETNEQNKDGVRTIAIDSAVQDRVTFIKLDIEGAELEALKGAKDIIQKYRPKLAICVYHKKEDYWEIPYYIKELVPDYKLYLRHYSNYSDETVLYAI